MAKRCLEIIINAVVELDDQVEGVIRTRIYLVNVNDWDAVSRAHGECFSAM
ncbi:MAG: hypothetical protein P8L66_03275 [Rhodospirillaceae bacterium]|nr:hypothetical protein [Rhodospirillaceae bacterium]